MSKNEMATFLKQLSTGEIVLDKDVDKRKFDKFIQAIKEKIEERLNDPDDYHNLGKFFIKFKNNNPQTLAVIFKNIFDDHVYIEEVLYELLEIDLKILINFANYFGVNLLDYIRY